METRSIEPRRCDAQMMCNVAFDFVEEVDVRTVLEEYYDQAQKALACHSYLGAVVGCGAVAEGVLTWVLKRNESVARKTHAARKHKRDLWKAGRSRC